MTEPFKPCMFITFDHKDKFVIVWWSVSSSCKRMFSINDSIARRLFQNYLFA